MDKLSTWQLLSELEKLDQDDSSKMTRDWMQIFCEDIVEPQFVSAPWLTCARLYHAF
jgi:hypothetical protein